MKKLTALILAIALCIGLCSFAVTGANAFVAESFYDAKDVSAEESWYESEESWYESEESISQDESFELVGTNLIAGRQDYTLSSNDGKIAYRNMMTYDGLCADTENNFVVFYSGQVTDGAIRVGTEDNLIASEAAQGITVELDGTERVHTYTFPLGAEKSVESVVVKVAKVCGNRGANIVGVEVSDDGSAWTNVSFTKDITPVPYGAQFNANYGVEGAEEDLRDMFFDITASFSPVNASYVRVSLDTSNPDPEVCYIDNGSRNDRGFILSFDEIEIYGGDPVMEEPPVDDSTEDESTEDYWDDSYEDSYWEESSGDPYDIPEIVSGFAGDDLTWTLNTVTGEFVLEGTGEMWPYGDVSVPWNDYRDYITSINIPDSVTSIGDYAFRGCTYLTSITIPDSVTYIGSSAFRSCTFLTSITIPDSVTYIGSSAFNGCTALTSATISDSVTIIWSFVFEGCTALTSISIPDSVTYIGDAAFSDCSSLTSITIPNGVDVVSPCAFLGCSSLETVYYGGTSEQWQQIEIGIGNSCLTDAELIYAPSKFEGASGTWGSLDWVLDIEGTLTISGEGEMADLFEIDNAWRPYSNVISKIVIENGITSIGQWAFADTNATSISIPNSVWYIGFGSFQSNKYLTSLSIPASITEINAFAFYDCPALTNITVHPSNDHFSDVNGVIFNKNKTNLLQYPIGKPDNSYPIPDGVNNIATESFSNCNYLTEITIPASVTSIEWDAFNQCYNLETVYYGGTLEQWQQIEIGSGNEDLTRANVVFVGFAEDESSEESSEDESTETEILIDNSAQIDDFTAGDNIATGGDINMSINGKAADDGGKLTDGAYRGDGIHGWDDDSLATEVIGAGTTVTYSFRFDAETDVASVVFRNVYISSATGFGTLYFYADTGASLVPLSLVRGIELTNVRYIPVEDADNYYNVVAQVVVNGAKEITLTLITSENSCLFDEIELYTSEADILYGDVNGDGVINSLDAAQLLKHDAKLITLETDGLTAADVNGDGVVNSLDAAQILKYDAKLITEF